MAFRNGRSKHGYLEGERSRPRIPRCRRAVRAHAGLASAAVLVAAFAVVAFGPVPPAGAVPPPGGATVVGQPGPDCPNPPPTSVQAAIDAAAPGATIYICAGVYTDQLTINKPLTLLGAQFGQDARTGRTDPSAETVFDVPADAIVYATGATTGTLDGFTLQDADGAAVFGINNAGAQGYTFQNNIVTGNATGMNIQTVGPAVTLISRNRFVANNKLAGSDPDSGTSIFITNGFVTGLTVEDNLFEGNVGDSAADINTPGTATPSSGITIRNNTSMDDSTFAVINNTTGTQVLDNSITHTNPAAASGTAILLFGTNTTAAITGNTINGGASSGIADFAGSQPSGGPTIANNSISNRTAGVRLSQAGATVSGNTIANSSQFGIWMQATASGGTIDGNSMTSTVGVDCQDDSTGSGTAGTANTWTANIGITSSPAGLCEAPPPPTTTPTTTATTSTTTPTTPTTTPAVLPPGPPSPGDPGGELPPTGAPASTTVILLAVLLIIGGIVLIRLRTPHET